MGKTFGIVAVGTIAGLSLQGCGGGGDDPSSPTATTTGQVQTANYPSDKLQFSGRWYDSGDGDKTMTWGQQVTAKFTGSGTVGIYMTANCPACIDHQMYFSYRI